MPFPPGTPCGRYISPRNVASNIADVATGAGDAGSASSQVLAAAKELTTEGSKLKIGVDEFLGTLRAA